MDVLLSIRPKYVRAIEKGTKKYEFRKVRFGKPVERAYIYATSPTRRVVGYFEVGQMVEDHPARLWESLGHWSGLSYDDFSAYYGENQYGLAIEIKTLVIFGHPIEPKELGVGFCPPQSFRYIDAENMALHRAEQAAVTITSQDNGG